MNGEVAVITDPDEIRSIALDLKKKQDAFFEARLKDVLGGIDTSWCVDDEHILGSDVAYIFGSEISNLVINFAMIHHLQAIHELGLEPGLGRPDFHQNGAVAFYQPTEMPASLEPYLGSKVVFEPEVARDTLPTLGNFALRNTRYFAIVGNSWAASRRRQDYERNDRRHHLFFSARVLIS